MTRDELNRANALRRTDPKLSLDAALKRVRGAAEESGHLRRPFRRSVRR